MNVKEAKEIIGKHFGRIYASPEIDENYLVSYGYAIGFLECWNKMKPVVDTLNSMFSVKTNVPGLKEDVLLIMAKDALKTIREIEGE